LGKVKEIVLKNIESAQKVQKLQYDKKKTNIEFNVGDFVYLRKEYLGKIDDEGYNSKKLALNYDGPFFIESMPTPETAKIVMEGNERETKTVHLNRLKLKLQFENQENLYTPQFIKGDIVFAKVKNCSFWPAKIVTFDEMPKKPLLKEKDMIPVEFYSASSKWFAFVEPEYIIKFEFAPEKFKCYTHRGFQQQYKLALADFNALKHVAR
jgi:PWWP domain